MKFTDAVIDRFSQSALQYHNEAIIQKKCAKTLINSLKNFSPSIISGPALEIGCGTGFITELLLKEFPDRNWLISDISPAMLEFCKKRVSPQGKISFACLDGENIAEKSKYALIVSGMTIQWFNDYIAGIKQLLEALKPEGILCLSFFNDECFPEWRQMCALCDLPFTGNPLPSISEIRDKIECSEKIIHSENITALYPSAALFFKHLKNIGADAAVMPPLTSEQMKKLIKTWDQKCPQGVRVTYHASYLMLKTVG